MPRSQCWWTSCRSGAQRTRRPRTTSGPAETRRISTPGSVNTSPFLPQTPTAPWTWRPPARHSSRSHPSAGTSPRSTGPASPTRPRGKSTSRIFWPKVLHPKRTASPPATGAPGRTWRPSFPSHTSGSSGSSSTWGHSAPSSTSTPPNRIAPPSSDGTRPASWRGWRWSTSSRTRLDRSAPRTLGPGICSRTRTSRGGGGTGSKWSNTVRTSMAPSQGRGREICGGSGTPTRLAERCTRRPCSRRGSLGSRTIRRRRRKRRGRRSEKACNEIWLIWPLPLKG
mmetsp:Transcript_21908/g.64668  ORF Transcript_21908/g.64668 Transcript_21908/m.64668 type:complete len:282 (+) Transcript_21908:1188-2033(+)